MFKIGDKVIIARIKGEDSDYTKALNKKGVITDIDKLNTYADVRLDNPDGNRTIYFPYLKNLELVKEEPIKLSKENKKIVKEVEEKIAVLENAKTKHLETVKRIDKQLEDLKVKKDKHMVEEVEEVEISFNELVKNYEESKKCKVKIVKEK